MTGKLIKYEIKSSIKLMAVMWTALIAASLLFSLSRNAMGHIMGDASRGSSAFLSIVELAIGLMYISIFIALIAATIIIVIMRFYKGLLGDEGYLMHTLPVKPWQLITSKGLVAAGVVLISIIVAMLSLALLTGISNLSVIPDIIGDIAKSIKEDVRVLVMLIEVLILIVASLLKSIYQVYASLAIGQLASKHRILLSLGAYIGLSTAVTVFGMLILIVIGNLNMDYWLQSWSGSADNIFSLGQVAIAGIFVLTVIQLIAFHVITERILSKGLNLQ